MFKSLVIIFAITVPLFPLVYFLTPRDLFFLPRQCSQTTFWLGLFTGLLAHILFFFAYVEFFYYVERSVTLRILVEIRKRPECTLEEVRGIYNMETMVADRVNVMRENGFVELERGLWQLTSKGKLFTQTFSLTRRILNLSPGQ